MKLTHKHCNLWKYQKKTACENMAVFLLRKPVLNAQKIMDWYVVFVSDLCSLKTLRLLQWPLQSFCCGGNRKWFFLAVLLWQYWLSEDISAGASKWFDWLKAGCIDRWHTFHLWTMRRWFLSVLHLRRLQKIRIENIELRFLGDSFWLELLFQNQVRFPYQHISI